MRDSIRAIGFDLFNTLITLDPEALEKARALLAASLQKSGFSFDGDSFVKAYREAAFGCLERARRDGRETHNRFWVQAALKAQGYWVSDDDPRIGEAVEDYFSVFLDHCHIVPGTTEMLEGLRKEYPLGLLSNFTHGPAAWKIIDRVGLTPFFHIVLISGELGFRKPHPSVFQRLMEGLVVEGERILFVGDDPECDIQGAKQVGLRPVWTTVVKDKGIPFALSTTSSLAERPVVAVPRISDWQDLIALLEGKGSEPVSGRTQGGG